MHVRFALAPLALLSVACFTPRSMGFGQTGALLSEGEAEIAVSPGIAYRSETFTQTDTTVPSASASSTSAGLELPRVEGNIAYGIAEPATLNLHLSPAGIQPGVKVRLVGDGPVRVAILPAIGFGYLSSNGTSSSSNGSTSASQTSAGPSLVDVLVGFKLIASHESGLYGGIGYDFEYANFSPGASGALGTGSSTSTSSTSASWHDVLLAVGYDAAFGGFKLRPELALLFAPSGTLTATNSSGTTTSNENLHGSAVTFFANVTFAAAGKTK